MRIFLFNNYTHRVNLEHKTLLLSFNSREELPFKYKILPYVYKEGMIGDKKRVKTPAVPNIPMKHLCLSLEKYRKF